MAEELIVLIVADPGLRSALIARLSMRHDSIVTLAAVPADDAVARFSGPAILVIDSASLRGRLHWLRDGARCNGMIILADRGARAFVDARVTIIDRDDALARVPETLAQWGAGRARSARLDQPGGKGDA